MRFYANHGCFAEERKIGTHFEVDLAYDCNTQSAQVSDNIDETVDYSAVYRIVKNEMAVPSHLLEHVADRIANALMDSFPAIEKLSITVYKVNPPLGGQIDSVSVSINRIR